MLSQKMPKGSLAAMIAFCGEQDIQTSFDLSAFDGDIFLTPNFPRLLPKDFVESRICVNAHYALLPKYRGFHPLQCALLNDEKVVGYSVHRVDPGMDSGPIYAQEKIDVTESDDIHTLTERLSDLLVENMPGYIGEILSGKRNPVHQDEAEAIWCGRRRPEDGLVNWNDPARALFNLVRAVRPPYYPGAYGFLGGERIVFVEVEIGAVPPYRHVPGQILCRHEAKGVAVKTGDAFIWVKRIRIGDVELDAGNYLGNRLGQRFSSCPSLVIHP